MMTTIAYRDGVLAADTMSTRGYTALVGITKIARGPDGRLGGACGTAGFMGMWLAWIRGERADPPEAKETDNNADAGLVIYPDGRVEIHEMGGSFELSTPYFAMGSGRDQAIGAMFMGANAETALRASIAHDVYTGGDVMVLTMADTNQ